MTSFFLFYLAFSLLPLPSAEGEPYLAAREGVSCMTCHISAIGTGMRSVEGREFSRYMRFPQNEKELSLEAPRLKVGDVPVAFGADGRVTYETSKQVDTFGTPLLAWYFHAAPTDQIEIAFTAEAAGTKEFFSYVKLDEAMRLKVGRFTLPYGLLLGDPRALLTLGSGFGTHVQDVGAELDVQWPTEGGGSFLRAALTNGTGLGSRIRATTVQAGMQRKTFTLGVSGQLHRGETGDRWRYGLFGWGQVWGLQALYELDLGQDPVTNALPIVWHSQVGVDLSSVVRVGAMYELWDPDYQVANDHRERVAADVRWFPLSFVEVVTSVAGVFRPSIATAYEGVISFHFFY